MNCPHCGKAAMPAWLMALIAVVTALLFFALAVCPARAQSLRVADQVFLPSAIHIVTPWAEYKSTVIVTNETDDIVNVTVTYASANGVPVITDMPDAFRLLPHQQLRINDILGPRLLVIGPASGQLNGLMNVSGFGQLIFTGCLDGADCGMDLNTAGNCGGACLPGYVEVPDSVRQNLRNISVTSQIYHAGPDGIGMVGQNLDAVARWNSGDPRNPLRLTGVEVDADKMHGVRTNIGIDNPLSTPVTVTVGLYDGASHEKRDERTFELGPLQSLQQGITELFPPLGEFVRANPQRPVTNAYVTVSSAVRAGIGAHGSFLLYGSRIDSASGAAVTLEARSDLAHFWAWTESTGVARIAPFAARQETAEQRVRALLVAGETARSLAQQETAAQTKDLQRWRSSEGEHHE